MGMTLKQVEKQIDPATYSDDDSWGQTIFNGTQHVWQGKGRWILVRFTADGRACSKEYGVKATNQVFMTRLENWLRKVVGR